MKIALISSKTSSQISTFATWLRDDGIEVTVVNDDATFTAARSVSFDLVIARVGISDYADQPNARYEAARYFERSGAKMINTLTTITNTSDKWKTFNCLSQARITTPHTFLVSKLHTWPSNQKKMILKPRSSHSGKNIRLVSSLAEARADENQIEQLLLQEYIEQPICLRVIASEQTVLSAYEKVLPGAVVVNIETGARRVPTVLDASHTELVCNTVAVLGGGILGLDLLIHSSGSYILEANIPFGFDTGDDSLRRNLIKAVRTS